MSEKIVHTRYDGDFVLDYDKLDYEINYHMTCNGEHYALYKIYPGFVSTSKLVDLGEVKKVE